jgi:uncharacterized protein (UPF0332 family)
MTDVQQSLLRLAHERIERAKAYSHGARYPRFEVGDAYFAMFYCAEAVLLSKELSFSKHAAVVSAFGREFVKSGELPVNLHDYILRAMDLRHDGDYEPKAQISEADADEQLRRAEEFIRETEKYLESK